MNKEINSDLVVKELSKLEPGFLPKEIFYSVARLVVIPTYVVIPFYIEDATTYVHLSRRSKDDIDFASMLCPIGKIILASDNSLEDTFKRLWTGEIANSNIKSGPFYVNTVFDQINRGKEISLIHWVLLNEKPSVGELFDIGKLPVQEIPKTDFSRIIMAIEHFKMHQND